MWGPGPAMKSLCAPRASGPRAQVPEAVILGEVQAKAKAVPGQAVLEAVQGSLTIPPEEVPEARAAQGVRGQEVLAMVPGHRAQALEDLDLADPEARGQGAKAVPAQADPAARGQEALAGTPEDPAEQLKPRRPWKGKGLPKKPLRQRSRFTPEKKKNKRWRKNSSRQKRK